MSNVRVTDARMPPFCWQDKAVLRLIQASFKKSEVATAIAIYVALTMYASNKHSDEFNLKRQTLCDFVGRSANVVDDYLGRLAEMGVIRKEPVVYDNMYRCMSFHLLPLPTGEVSLPTGTHPTADSEACPDQQGSEPLPAGKGDRRISSLQEESRGPRNAGPTAPHGDGRAVPKAAPSTERREGAAPATRGGGAGHLHPGGGFRSESGGSGMILPGERGPDDSRSGGLSRKRTKEEKQADKYDAGRPLDKWRVADAIGYFQRRFNREWPGEPRPAADPKKDAGAVKGRLAWLDQEGVGRAMMRDVIDYIFAQWEQGLRERLRWDGARPGLALIESARYFETLVREVMHGVPERRGGKVGPRHDEWNEERAKKLPSAGWGD